MRIHSAGVIAALLVGCNAPAQFQPEETDVEIVYVDAAATGRNDGATGAALREYIYSGLTPVAYVDHSGASLALYFVHTDQVMRPRKLTDASKAIVWDRVATPFGEEVQTTGTLTQNVRIPGQTNDSVTALNQNWHREYDPSLGRYVQSDPIGLIAGVNTYAYASSNPLKAIDVDGRAIFLVIPGVCAAGACEAAIAGAAALTAYILYGDEASNALEQAYTGAVALCRSGDDPNGCDKMYENDGDTCRAISKRRGKRAGQRCWASAAQRYSECLAGGGPGSVRTPLDTWNN